MTKKDTEVAIQLEGKETLSERLRTLIGQRSARKAAKDWGLSFSTLNNYLNRGTEPSFSVVIRIAEIEGISIEWLASGGDLNSKKPQKTTPKEFVNSEVAGAGEQESAKFAWSMVYDSIDQEDIEALLRLIHREGVRGILNSKRSETPMSNDFQMLTEEQKQRVLRLAKQLREGDHVDCEENELTPPTHKQAS